MSATRLPCGCKRDDRRWLVLCEPHLLEWFDTHSIAGKQSRPALDPQVGAKKDVR
jgi:hypothetical protein